MANKPRSTRELRRERSVDELAPREFIKSWQELELQERRDDLSARKTARSFIFVMFTMVTAITLAIIILHGLRILALDREIVLALAAGTVGEIATLLALVYKYLFPESK